MKKLNKIILVNGTGPNAIQAVLAGGGASQ